VILGRAWSGVLVGLLLGAALGVALLGVKTGVFNLWAPRSANPDRGEVQTVEPGSGPADTGHVHVAPDPDATLNTQRSNAIVRATRQVAPAVVSINVVQNQAVNNPSIDFAVRMGLLPRRDLYRQVQSMGSGVILSSDGTIVTNSHVIAGAVQVIVTLSDGRQYQARLVDEVERYDLAILQIEGENLPVAHLAEVDDLQIGEWAIAIGSPYGYLLADTQPTVTVGVISALNRDIKRAQGEREYLGMIQTDAAINPGNSGGPLVNTTGDVVGVNTFIFSEAGGSVGIGFAVPASRVRSVLEEIQTFGHYREFSLGFRLQILSPGMVQFLELDDPVGFLVTAVIPDSPAWKAGLRPRDILREVEGVPLSSGDIMHRVVYERSVGDSISFRAERDHQSWTGQIFIEELR